MFRKTRLFLFLLLSTIVCGCGVKGDPVPPRSTVPAAIKDLSILSREGQVVLQWSVPQSDTEGKELTGVAGFNVWRGLRRADDECPECPQQYGSIAQIDYQSLQAYQKGKNIITFWDDQKKEEGIYRYVVTSYSTYGIESEKSNPVDISWAKPFPPPDLVSAMPGDRVVDLSWDFPPGFLSEGSAVFVKGFNIYRRSEGQAYPLIPLNASLLQEGLYRDIGVVNGEMYYYVVRTLRESGVGLIEGGSSAEILTVPEDRTPPAPPTAAMAFQTAEGVVLIWEPSGESDLAGYFVYRRLAGEDALVRISTLIEGETRFVDTAFSPGRVYYYSITAADRAAHRNESGFSQELRVETGGP